MRLLHRLSSIVTNKMTSLSLPKPPSIATFRLILIFQDPGETIKIVWQVDDVYHKQLIFAMQLNGVLAFR